MNASEPKTYRLERISDLLQVPIERREDCVRELLYGLALLDLAAGDECNPELKSLVWTDDGETTIDLDLGGDNVLSLVLERAT